MKAILYVLLPLLVTALIGAGTIVFKRPAPADRPETPVMLGCGPVASAITADDHGKFVPVLPGWGRHGYAISTANDSTQFYFNQGLNLYYSYHLREALASFKEAARFDSTCAMAYWGQALAMGPYYNNYYFTMRKEVPGVISGMNGRMAGATAKEKALIKAMQQRYSADTTNADRAQLDSSYAAAMSGLTRQYPGDYDIKALYIDAVMLVHKWDFWKNDGNPKPWTPELTALCREILSQDPSHPAALHYYIHVTEASRHPEVALAGADRLKEVMPGVAHMVHMATHMYQRNGLFAKGVTVNEEANTAYNNFDALAPSLGLGKNKSIHIYAVQSYCAMTAGMLAKGMPVYLRARNTALDLVPAMEKDAYSQYVYMMPVLAWVRLGRWEEILKSPAPDTTWNYASLLDEFARGLAHIHNRNTEAAAKSLASLELRLQDPRLAVRQMPFNRPVQCGRIAAGILKGELLYGLGKTGEAITAFQRAVQEEDGLVYREPQDWLIPARQYLGAYLMKMNKAKEAEKVYREDLIANPGNGWSLAGLYKSLSAQQKTTEAATCKAAYLRAFSAADIIPVASAF